MNTKVTRSEALALDKEYNLSDAHTYQLPTASENETIFHRFSEFYEEAVKLRGPELDRGAFEAFMKASRQPTATKNLWFLPTYAASISTEIVSNALRGNFDEIFLVEPTFDNIADIFKRNDFNVRPIRLRENKSYFQSITDTIKGNGLTRTCLFLVAPNNPTGHGLSKQEFKSLCQLCAERSITILFDFCFRVFDPSCLYDQYETLLQSGVRFIALEDTGKIWPTVDLKTSFITSSEEYQESILSIYDDFLLNVSPFISLLVKRYSEYETSENFRTVVAGISRNREKLIELIQASGIEIEFPFPNSRLSVELLRLPSANFDSAKFAEFSLQKGIAVLSGNSFYWSAEDEGLDQIRVALARPHDYFELAARKLLVTLEEYLNSYM